MKTTIEFDNDERAEMMQAVHAVDILLVIFDIQEYLLKRINDDESVSEEIREELMRLSGFIWDQADERCVGRLING